MSKSRRVALDRLIDTLDILDDDASFAHLLTLATDSGFTSLARDVRLIRVRIDCLRDNVERAKNALKGERKMARKNASTLIVGAKLAARA